MRDGTSRGAPTGELGQSLRLLATRRFGTFWFASLLSNIGTWAQQVAEPWVLLSVGASSFLIGLDSFAMNAPVWLFTLAGGVLADRADRRRVIALFQSLQMLCPTVIVVLLLTRSVRAWPIIGLSLIVGITDALSMPSFQSIVPSLVEREQIGRGLALNSIQFNLSRILGPALAGVLMAGIGAVACFALSAASYIPFIGVALWILPRRTHVVAREHAPLEVRHPFASVRQVASAPALRGALLTVLATSVLCSPVVTFVPVLVKNALHGDATRFSAVVGGFGVGGLLGGMALLALPAGQDRRTWSSRLAAAYGVVVVATALVPTYWVLPLLMIVGGGAMTMSNTLANTLVQSTAPAGLLGQSVSLYMLAMRGGIALGSVLTGLAVDHFGIRQALAVNGALAIVAHLAIGRAWARSDVHVSA